MQFTHAWRNESRCYRVTSAAESPCVPACSVLGTALFDVEAVSGGGGGMVMVRDIEFASTSSANLLPFHGRCHIAYMPARGVVLGLSKFARLTGLFARRFQDQQQFTDQVTGGSPAHLPWSALRLPLSLPFSLPLSLPHSFIWLPHAWCRARAAGLYYSPPRGATVHQSTSRAASGSCAEGMVCGAGARPQILHALTQQLSPAGTAVLVEAKHMAEGPDAPTHLTSAAQGLFTDPSCSCTTVKPPPPPPPRTPLLSCPGRHRRSTASRQPEGHLLRPAARRGAGSLGQGLCGADGLAGVHPPPPDLADGWGRTGVSGAAASERRACVAR